MQWLNPAGAWAFLALAPVVALYLLRKRQKQVKVPSLLLWRLTESHSDANRPFQKLKNQLLLWLQLLAVLLLAVALMRPASLGGAAGESVLIFDLSASMQTRQEGGTRLEAAKEAAYALLDAMGENDAVSVLTAGHALRQPVARTTDHGAARRAIQAFESENGAADVSGAVALAQAMHRELPELGIVVLSDTYEGAPEGVSVIAVGQSMPNRSLSSLRVSQQEDGSLLAFAQLTNRGAATEAELECYGDGTLCDVRTVALPEDGSATVRFTLPEGVKAAEVRFAQPDALPADDARYALPPAQTGYRALLVSEGNVFLEKALALRTGLSVVKASAQDALGAEGYDLYVFDGNLPETLPLSGALLALAPEGPVLDITPMEAKQGGGVLRAGGSAMAEKLCEHLLLSQVALKSYRPLQGGQSVLLLGGDTLLAYTEQEGRRAAVLGFDLHQSNLPLQADFPLLVQNLLGVLLPENTAEVSGASCGDTVALMLDDRTVSAAVRTPSGRERDASSGTLEDTGEIGFYTLTEQRADGSARTSAFALHIPAGESDTLTVSASVSAAGPGSTSRAGREWTVWALLLCLMVLLLEWEVSRRGA